MRLQNERFNGEPIDLPEFSLIIDRKAMSIFEEVAERELHLSCASLRFERQGVAPLSFQGPGQIEQDSDGRFHYVVHLDAKACNDLTASHSARRLSRGTILSNEDFLMFEATAYSGPSWKGRVTEPNLTTGLSGSGIAKGTVHELRSDRSGYEVPHDYAKIYLPHRVEFPAFLFTQTETKRGGKTAKETASRDNALFKCGEEEFSLYHNATHTEIDCSFESGGVSANRHLRLLEALQLALGQPLFPCGFELTGASGQTHILRSPIVQKDNIGRQHPPLIFQDVPPQSDVYKIAECYYRSVLEHREALPLPLSLGSYSLLRTANGPIELQVLALSVAAEELIACAFPEIVAQDEQFENEVKALQKRLGELGISKRLQKRLDGSLGAMLKPRNSDRLWKFVEQYEIPERVFESWKDLRNPSAHGGQIPMAEVNKVFRELLDVLYLCYRFLPSKSST